MRQLQFDATVDDFTSAHLLFMKRTPAWQRARRTGRLVVGGMVGGILLFLMLPRVSRPGWEMPALVVALAALGALIAALSYGPIYDSEIRKSVHRQSRELIGDAGVLRCAMELRPDGLWASQNGMEMLFPWTHAEAVEDLDEGVFVSFRTGFALIRTRAFADAAERKLVLDEARRLAGR